MNNNMVTLQPYSNELCHEYWKEYISDPDMWDFEYVYDYEKVENYYQIKIVDKTRIIFAICVDDKIIGEIQLKKIDVENKHATLSIAISNNQYKNHGYGTKAQKLIIDYAFNQLNLKIIYADVVHKNLRSMHVLEKVGFKYTHNDEIFSYFCIQSVNYKNENKK